MTESATDPRFVPEPDAVDATRPDWVRRIVGSAAAGQFAWAGWNMIQLQTENGNTIAELFDQYMGYFSFGVALVCIAWAWSRPNR